MTDLPTMEKPTLRGRLESFRLYDLLTLMNISAKTGTLVLEHGQRETRIFFKKGSLVFASSDQERLRLGAILREKRRINTLQFAEIEKIMTDRSEKFGEAAIETGTMTSDQVIDFLKVQVSEIIYDAFVWTGGDFYFLDSMDIPEWAVEIKVDISNLIMEGARRIDEWNQCTELIPDDGIIFRLVDNPEVQEKISLSKEEWKVLFHIDGQNCLRDLLGLWQKDPLDLYRIVYGLLASKLIEELRSDERTTVQQTPLPREPIPSPTYVPLEAPSDRTAPVTPLDVEEISDTEWHRIEDDTKLLLAEKGMSYRDIMKVAVFNGRLSWKNADGDRVSVIMSDDHYTLGRTPDNDIHVEDSGVSSKHAELTRTELGYEIRDLNSHNGTWVNGSPVDRKLLRNDDGIQVGRIRMQYNVIYELPDLEEPEIDEA